MKTLSFEMNIDSPLAAREVPTQRVAELSITAPKEKTTRQRPALNLAIVIDRSGSMAGEKLEYVKQAAGNVLDLLQEQDRVALVAYDSEVSLLSPRVPVTRETRKELKTIIHRLQSGSMTFLSGGWLKGCAEVAEAVGEGTLNRVLLLTDGLANQGITDLEELGRHASELASRGVPTSTFGVGLDYNEHLLEHVANQGGGQYYYIDHPQKIPAIFEQELKEIAAVTASNVEVVIDLPANTAAEVSGNWRTEKKTNQLHIWLGDIGAGNKREFYLKLLLPPMAKSERVALMARVMAMDAAGIVMSTDQKLELQYVPESEAKDAILDVGLRQRFAIVDLADSKNEALKRERTGDIDGAVRLYCLTVDCQSRYLSNEDIDEARHELDSIREGLQEIDRKSMHSIAYQRKQGRPQR